MKACAVIAIFVTVAVSKNKFVFDDAKKAVQFGRDWARANKLVQDDDGRMQNSAVKVRKLDNFGRGFTCKWKCRCDQPAASKPVSPEPVSPKPEPEPVLHYIQLQNLSQVKDDMKFCIKSQATRKVLKVQANGELDQFDSSKCEDATIFQFKKVTHINGLAVVYMYNPETEKFLTYSPQDKLKSKIFEESVTNTFTQKIMIYDNRFNKDKTKNKNFFYFRHGFWIYSIAPNGENKDHLVFAKFRDNENLRFSIMIQEKSEQ